MGVDEGNQMMPPDGMGGGAPEQATSLDVAIGFVTEFNENTAIFAQVASMLMGMMPIDPMMPMQPMSPWGQPLVTGFGPGVDPETGMPLEGPWEAEDTVPVDLPALRSQVSSLEGQVTALDGNVSSIRSEVKGAVNEAISRATTAQRDASEARGMARQAMSVAQKALSKAGSSGNSAHDDSHDDEKNWGG